MNNSKFTVVVPIYNVERFLAQCLDSLLYQSDSNFKVVMVNDGSKDNSGEIAKEYEKKYPDRFLYVEQVNKGLGAARNTGLVNTKTDFVAFLDSDDMWKPNTAKLINECLEKHEEDVDLVFMTPVVYDMATSGFFDWKDNELVKGLFEKNGEVFSAEDEPMLYKSEASVCRLVIKKKILDDNGFAFPEGIKWEDVTPHFQILHWAKKCVLLEGAGFIYRVNSGNQITASSDRGRLDIVKSYGLIFDYAQKNNWKKQEYAYIFDMLMEFIAWFLRETRRDVYPELVKTLHEFARKLPGKFFKAYCEVVNPTRKRKTLWILLKSKTGYIFLLNPQKASGLKKIFYKLKELKNRR